MTSAAFYCVSSARYFLGAVAMINSLRLTGHGEPVFVLDCGLTREQRECLDGEATVLAAPSETAPFMLKTVAPLAHPADVVVLIDADMIVTRPLGGLIEEAARGRVVAPELPIERFFPEWGELLGLGPARRRPYVTSGLVLLGGAVGREVLGLMDDHQGLVELERTFLETGASDYPLHYADQDLLNAVLATRIEEERVLALEGRLVATMPFEGLKLVNAGSLRCAYADGAEPYVVHHVLDLKPWLEPARDSIYSRLMRRCLVGPDLAVRVPEGSLPLRLRSGPLAYLERKRAGAAVALRWHAGIRMHRLGTRLRALPRRSAASKP